MEAILEHIKKFVTLKQEDEPAILDFFQLEKYAKKENLMEAGSVCKSLFFVLKGCLRLYYISEKGVEQTVQFAMEDWWLSDYYAFERHERSDFYIQAIEETEVLRIDLAQHEQLLGEFPVLERYFRILYQKIQAANQRKGLYQSDFSREEFYAHFHRSFPDFSRRIPQYMLASYLQMTPEYLSEIKRKKRS
ncbi:Crp/Fnr family transcriptional regulator [Sphingobacterium sp. MYb382]|uniref:Crp/Fnr family transcriptional regulator n=1 Tax=Sphingobacterium sp. MYb382 TaxID=2745278 RepID=UPI00309C8CD7